MFENTVDGVLAQFNSAIKKLDKIAQAQAVASDKHKAEAEKHVALAKEADSEGARAYSVAAKIHNLIS